MHVMRSSVGYFSSGDKWKEPLVNFVLHQGQFSRGTGDALRSSLRYAIVLARAESRFLSFTFPITLGVAALPTHKPISNGHSPNLVTSFCRSNSRAQISVDARLNWSSVSSRRV